MHRRALLATLATGCAAVAGCSFASGTDGNSAPTDEPNGTDDPGGPATDEPDSDPGNTGEPPEPPDGRASVIELETGPRTYSLVRTRLRTDDGASIPLWFDRTATPDHPARVRGYLRNENPFENTFQGPCLDARNWGVEALYGSWFESPRAARGVCAGYPRSLRSLG